MVVGRARSLRGSTRARRGPTGSAVARQRARHSPARTRPDAAYKKTNIAHANIDRSRNGTRI